MLAAFLSFMPGLGNIYNGLYARGISFFLVWAGLMSLAVGAERDEDIALLAPSIGFFFLFNVIDAYRQATLINLGYAPGDDALARRRAPRVTAGTLLPGVMLLVVGIYGVFRLYFEVDFSRLLEHWPLGALALGLFLIVQAVRERSKEAASPASID